MTFFNRVYDLCKEIPRGKVTTYGAIAKKLNSKAYRLVGQALRNNPNAPIVPCHRVVNFKGEIHGFGGETKGEKLDEKAELLKGEGVRVKEGRVLDFEKFLHKFE
tara:strand:- start:306 stop:620 length:315 start_codon:yes stop_codon:yes gene_type:complete